MTTIQSSERSSTPKMHAKFAHLPRELVTQIMEQMLYSHERNQDRRERRSHAVKLLTLSRDIYRQLAPPYYRSKYFVITSRSDLMDGFIETASDLCIANVETIVLYTNFVLIGAPRVSGNRRKQFSNETLLIAELIEGLSRDLRSLKHIVARAKLQHPTSSGWLPRGPPQWWVEGDSQGWWSMLEQDLYKFPSRSIAKLRKEVRLFSVDHCYWIKFCDQSSKLTMVGLREKGKLPKNPAWVRLDFIDIVLTRRRIVPGSSLAPM